MYEGGGGETRESSKATLYILSGVRHMVIHNSAHAQLYGIICAKRLAVAATEQEFMYM